MARFPVLLLIALVGLLAACSQATPPTAEPLQVVNHVPGAGATDVPVDVAVVVEFDGPLDADELFKPIRVTNGGAVVEGALSYDQGSNALVFVPEADLDHGAEYEVTVSATVTGLSGASLRDAVTWTFTTVAADDSGSGGEPGDEVEEDDVPEAPGLPGGDDGSDVLPPRDQPESIFPGILTVSPKPWTYAARDTSVEVVFNKEFDDQVLRDGVRVKVFSTFTGFIYALIGLDLGSKSGHLSADGDTVTFTPHKRLSGDMWHWVFLSVDVKDDDGNRLKDRGYWVFKTVR